MPARPIWRRQAYGFTRIKREGDDIEAINRLFAPEFRNRLDAIITFAHLTPEIIAKVVEKFVLQLEAQLGDRDVTIELSEEATQVADRPRLRRADGRAADGASHSGEHQEGARRRSSVRQAQDRRACARHRCQGRGRVRTSSAFEYLEGPITPKPEKIPEAKPKRRSPRRKPSGPKGGGGPPSPRGSVPKVPPRQGLRFRCGRSVAPERQRC